MAPEQRVVPRFAAEPPQEELPHGRWHERLREEFLAAALALSDPPADLGEPGEMVWYPDRSWHGRTYIPGTVRTTGAYELFGYVRFIPGSEQEEPSQLEAHVDFTDETAERNPGWQLDLCDEVIGSWRGQFGASAAMTLVWGRPIVSGGRIVTAELAGLAVDQCELVDERFTLIAPDDYGQDLLEIKLWDVKGRELASESLYEEGDAEEEKEEDEEEPGA
jgi:hypothetical protein